MNKFKLAVTAAVLLSIGALAGPIHTWVSGEYITSTDLNAAFTHIHGTMVGGHGPRLVNADVSSAAALSHAKMATPALLPKAWSAMNAVCTVGTCTLVDNSVVTSVAFVSTGVYTVTFPTRGSANYGTLTTAYGNLLINCGVTAKAATTATVTCVTGTTGAVVNGAFTFMLLDSEN